jgi:hypothetical protein
MTKDEALDLALEALATEEYRLRQIGQSQVYPGIGFAIAAIKQARSAPVQEPVLQEIEQYRLQMAGISTAAIGYWKEGDGIHPDYDTPALRDVAKLYAKYDALYTAAQPTTEESSAVKPAAPVQEPKCNPHPKAPHGFDRNASHSADRYVCECEGWDAYDAGYQAGIEDTYKRMDALDKKAENARELGLDYEPAEVLGHNGWGFPIKAAAPVQKKCDCAAHSAADCVCGAWDKSAAAPVREDWGPGPHECHSLTAAQRQWVGLTDEERHEIMKLNYARTEWLVHATEAKLKEKNT